MTLATPGLGTAEIGRALFRAEKAVRDNVTALLAKTSLATPSACPARGAITSTQAWVPAWPSRCPDT
jgi:DNA-binding NarL/FixJ family response regulator